MIISSPESVQCSMSGLAKRRKFAISAPASPAPMPDSTKAASL